MNMPATSTLYYSPTYFLQHGRALACASAVGLTEPSKELTSLIKLLGAPTFRPKESINYQTDCRPYVPIVTPNKGAFVFMTPWARAGVRYLKPGFDLSALAPASFYTNWWPLYQAMFPHIPMGSAEEEVFTAMFTSLGDSESDILALLDVGRLMLKPEKIKRLLAGSTP